MAVYLDYNATAPVYPDVIARMQALLAVPSNPSSAHRFGRDAKKHLEDARKIIAAAISAWPNEIIFTASGTEANAMALRGFAGRRLLVSAVEHSSVLSALSHRERGGASRGEGASMPGMSEGRLPHPNPLPEGEGMIPVGVDGIVNLAALDAMLASGQPALVSVMLGNNETGIIQPVAEVAALCKKYQALFHCDAVQGLGKIAVDFGAIGADMMTVSAHKCGGPLGAAALVVRRDLAVTPLLRGGGQELGRRAGTENIAAIAGFALAVEKGYGSMAELRRWLDALEAEAVAAGGTVVGGSSPRLPNTSCIAMPGVSSEVQLMDFDLKGFAVSAGSACSSGRIEVSHVLAAMGVEKDIAACAIRVSGGWHTTQGEVLAFGQAWKKLRGRLGKK